MCQLVLRTGITENLCSGAGERMPSRDPDPGCPGSPVAPVPKTG